MIILLFIESRLNFINIPLNSTFKSSINYEYIVYRNENPISCFLEFLVSLMFWLRLAKVIILPYQLVVELKVANDPQYSQSEKKIWFKVDEEFVKMHSSDIDWLYSGADVNVENFLVFLKFSFVMWSEMVNKSSLPWDCSYLVRKESEKTLCGRS